MSKKVIQKRFCFEQDKKTPKVISRQLALMRKISFDLANLKNTNQRAINEIQEEAAIRNNIRIMIALHQKYIEEIGKIKMLKENEIKDLEKRKKSLKKN